MVRSNGGLRLGSTCSKCHSSKSEIMVKPSRCLTTYFAIPVGLEVFRRYMCRRLGLDLRVDTEYEQGVLTWCEDRPSHHCPSATPLSVYRLVYWAKALKSSSSRAAFREDSLRWACQLRCQHYSVRRACIRAAQTRCLGLVPTARSDDLCMQRLDPQLDLRRLSKQTCRPAPARVRPELLNTSRHWSALYVLGLKP